MAPSELVERQCYGRSCTRRARPNDRLKFRIIDSAQLPWNNGFELVEVADAKGFFAQAGLDFERVPLPPEQYPVAVDSGQTDFAPYADCAYFINVRDKGIAVREVVASSLPIDPDILGDGVRLRHEIWRLLHDEVTDAQRVEAAA